MTAVTVDLTDVDAFADQRHYDVFAWLRCNDPVHLHADGERSFWALTRYDDVAHAYADHLTFSSSGGPMLGGSFQKGQIDTAANRMLVASDNPRHRLLRPLMQRVFGPDYVKAVGRQVSTMVDATMSRMLADGGGDFATGMALDLPAAALMVLMDLSRDDALHVVDLTRQMIGFRDPRWRDPDEDERLHVAVVQAELMSFFADLLDDRRDRSGRDLVSVLASATLNGRPLSDEDILLNCLNVAVGGDETSSHTASAAVLALIENPNQWQLLADDPTLVEPGVNEMLRWATTNAYVLRMATRDVEIRGRLIRTGDAVTLWNVSANRDDDHFSEADRFLVSRSPNRHITYGVGVHRCIGAALAQRELTVLFWQLCRRGVRFALAGPVERLRSTFIQGINHLPLTVVDAKADPS
jgi:cytochrome P450